MTEGDARFLELYDQFYRSVYGYCRRRLDVDRVDDAVAETFLVAWRKIDQVPRGSEVLPWLFGVAHRVIGHEWRGSSRRRRLNDKLADLGALPPDMPDDVVVQTEESALVLHALRRLNATDREIIQLAAWEELPMADIAVALNLSAGAVRQRFYQAKKNLVKEYDRLAKRSSSPGASKGGVR